MMLSADLLLRRRRPILVVSLGLSASFGIDGGGPYASSASASPRRLCVDGGGSSASSTSASPRRLGVDGGGPSASSASASPRRLGGAAADCEPQRRQQPMQQRVLGQSQKYSFAPPVSLPQVPPPRQYQPQSLAPIFCRRCFEIPQTRFSPPHLARCEGIRRHGHVSPKDPDLCRHSAECTQLGLKLLDSLTRPSLRGRACPPKGSAPHQCAPCAACLPPCGFERGFLPSHWHARLNPDSLDVVVFRE